MLPTEGNWWGVALEDRDEVPFTKDALSARSTELRFFGSTSMERDGPWSAAHARDVTTSSMTSNTRWTSSSPIT